MSILVETPMTDNPDRPRGGRPALSSSPRGSSTRSDGRKAYPAAPMIFGANDQMLRADLAKGDGHAKSRARLLIAAFAAFLDEHGQSAAPPIKLIPSGGVKEAQRNYTPDGDAQEAGLAGVAREWGVPVHDVRRVALELYLVKLGYRPASDFEEGLYDPAVAPAETPES